MEQDNKDKIATQKSHPEVKGSIDKYRVDYVNGK